jgi:hypothetical protein
MRDGVDADNDRGYEMCRYAVVLDEDRVYGLFPSRDQAVAYSLDGCSIEEAGEGWHYVVRRNMDGSTSLRAVLDQRHAVPPLPSGR